MDQKYKMRNVPAEIGKRLKKLRESSGKKQSDLGKLLGITPAAYGKIEAGDRGLSSEYCILLSDYYNVSCNYILRGIEAENFDVWKQTGLSDRAILGLKAHCRYRFDELFACKEFWRLIEHIDGMTDYLCDPITQEHEWDFNSFYAHKYLIQLLNHLREDSLEDVDGETLETVRQIRSERDDQDTYKKDRAFFYKSALSPYRQTLTFTLNDDE